ncbi:MAG: glutathione S-transferase family protein [Polyangiales bacterium]
MTSLRLWGQPRSINVQKVLWALEELGLQYERIDAGGSFGKVKEPAYLALNPNGLVPTLEIDGNALWESNAIVRHLFTRFGSAPLQPSDPFERARADAFTDWGTNTFWAPTRVLLVQLVRTAEKDRDARQIETARGQVLAALKILEGELSKRPFVAGQAFSWGDIALASAAQRWFNLPIERPSFPAVEAWYGRIRERAAFQKVIDLPLT